VLHGGLENKALDMSDVEKRSTPFIRKMVPDQNGITQFPEPTTEEQARAVELTQQRASEKGQIRRRPGAVAALSDKRD
jgi:hypothetical protein